LRKLLGWMNRKQALDLRSVSAERLKAEVAKIAESINADKRKGLLIVGGLLTALLLLK
jgi:tRNA nucleotidyltransferase/poly(A) polymerase